MGDNVKKVQDATDKRLRLLSTWTTPPGLPSANSADEYLKFTGKKELDASKYLKTPTNKEKFGVDAKAESPHGSRQGRLSPTWQGLRRPQTVPHSRRLTPSSHPRSDRC